jgi:hypothetical protein
MTQLFNTYKQVRPKTKILAEDINGLQDSLVASFNSLGEPVLESAPEGSRGVSTPFSVGDPVQRSEAVNKGVLDDMGLNGDTLATTLARAEAAVVTSEAAALAANNTVAGSHVHADLTASIQIATVLALAGI